MSSQSFPAVGTGPSSLSSHECRILSEILRLTIPKYPTLDDSIQGRVREYVVRFVAFEVGAMPTFLRWPYRMVIVAFNLLPILRYARPFVALREDQKASYLSFWSNGRIGPMRDFVKLIRSCAVLAYFDHEEVRRALDTAPTPFVEVVGSAAGGGAG